jgi:adenosylmethionine-8-amino-7-oxononanoate aminotransferase
VSSSALIHNSFDAQLPVVSRGEGVYLYDEIGNQYIDGSSGAVVSAIGHAHPRVVEVLSRQAAEVAFTHRGAFTSAPAEELADTLSHLTDYPGVWLVNSGSEAIEAALQFALQYYRETGRPERTQFLSHSRGYHGNTLGGLSLSGHGRRAVVGELAAPWTTLPTPRRSPDDADTDAEFASRLLGGVRGELERTRGTVAGIVVEAVGGATLGVVIPPHGYLQGLRSLCDEFDVLLIFDEVMSGLGRTGRVFAADHWAVRADIQVVGKGLGAGYTPIAATLLGGAIVNSIERGTRRVLGGHTYAANPLSARVALEVLRITTDEKLIDRAEGLGAELGAGLRDLASQFEVVTEVRGLGLMWGVELSNCGQPAGSVAAAVTAVCRDHGLIVYQASGGFNDAILIAPPLTISHAEIAQLLAKLGQALFTLTRKTQTA